MKVTKKELTKLVEEVIDNRMNDPFYRAEGLVHMENYKTFKKLAMGLISDLLEEGFESDEAKKFLIDTINNHLMSK